MRPYMYILLLAVALMLYKTFYWDYKKKEVPLEANTSVESVEVIQLEPAVVKTVEPKKSEPIGDENKTGWQSRKGMPIDRLGDTIGASLKDKINIK